MVAQDGSSRSRGGGPPLRDEPGRQEGRRGGEGVGLGGPHPGGGELQPHEQEALAGGQRHHRSAARTDRVDAGGQRTAAQHDARGVGAGHHEQLEQHGQVDEPARTFGRPREVAVLVPRQPERVEHGGGEQGEADRGRPGRPESGVAAGPEADHRGAHRRSRAGHRDHHGDGAQGAVAVGPSRHHEDDGGSGDRRGTHRAQPR